MASAVAPVIEQQEDQVGTNPIFDGIRDVVERHLQQLGREPARR